MVIPSPLAKHDEILRRVQIQDLAVQAGEPVNVFVWNGIKQDLLKLVHQVSSEASKAHASLAAIQVARGPDGVEDFQYHARRAIADPKLSANSYHAVMTSAAQLAEPAVFDETLQAALARLVPIDVRHYVGCMMQLGRLKEAAIHIEANRQAFAGSENIFGPDEIVEAANFLEEQGVDDASLSLRVHFASKTLMTLSGRGVYNCIIEPTAAGVIFGFPSPADDESRANYDIAITEALIDNFDDPLFEAVSFVVYPLELYQTFVKLSREQGEPAFGFV